MDTHHTRAHTDPAHVTELIGAIGAIVYEARIDTPESMYVSAATEQILGFPASTWLDGPSFPFGLLHPDDREATIELCAEARRAGRDHRYEARFRTATGDYVWLRDDVRIHSEGGTPISARGVMIDVTIERDRAEAASRAMSERNILGSEAEYRTLVEHVPAIVYIAGIGAAGPWSYVSPQVEDVLGFTPQEWTSGTRWFQQLHPDDRDRVLSEEYGLSSGKTNSIASEYRLISKQGEPVWLRDEYSLVRDEQGQPVFFRGVMLDISARKLAEEKLADAEAKYRTLVERISAITYTSLATDSRPPLYISPQSQDLLGVGQEDFDADPLLWPTLIHPDDLNRVLTAWRDSLASGRDFECEYRCVGRAGGVVWFRDQATLVAGDGAPLLAQGLMLDVTQRKEMETALEEREQRLRLLVQQIPAVLWTTDTDLRFTSGSGGGLRSLGLEDNALVGLRVEDYFSSPDPDFEPIVAHRQALLGHSSHFQVEWSERSYETYLEPLRDQDGQIIGAVGVALDVSDRVVLQQQLNQSQKMEAIGQLAGGVAHDFNNLLAVIQNYARFVLDDLGNSHSSYEDVKEIAKAGERAADLTRRLLAFARKQDSSPTVMNINDRVIDMERLLRRTIRESIRLKISLDPSLGRVSVDSGQLEQVLLNLAVNAKDAMPDGGTLTIATAEIALEESRLPSDNLVPGRYAQMQVSDTGEGIPPEIIDRIFEPFFTTKGVGKGTGLGLSMAYGIIRGAGGCITVDSTPAGGTTFTVYLPLAGSPKEETPVERPEREISGAGQKILVVEDEDAVRDILNRILSEHGYRVLTASSGEEAVGLAGLHPDTALLLTDLVMPGMSGKDLAAYLVTTRPELKTLFISGYLDEAGHRDDIPDDVEHMIAKPFTAPKLLQRVARVLNEEPAQDGGTLI